MSDIKVTDVRFAIFQKGDGAVPHQHDFYQMYHVISGTGRMRLKEEIVEIGPHMVILIAPGNQHGICDVTGETPLRFLNVQFLIGDSEIKRAFQEMPNRNSAPASFLDLLWKVKMEWSSENILHNKMANGLFEQYFVEYFRINKRAISPANEIEKHHLTLDINQLTGVARMIADYVQVHYASDISLEKIAEDLAYSKNYLCKAFKKATGMTVISYINRFRVEKALELIRSTDKKLTEINDMVGYNDFHYFSRVFKSVIGHSPREMRDKEKFSIYLENKGSPQTIYRYYSQETGNKKK